MKAPSANARLAHGISCVCMCIFKAVYSNSIPIASDSHNGRNRMLCHHRVPPPPACLLRYPSPIPTPIPIPVQVVGETWEMHPELKLIALKRMHRYSVRGRTTLNPRQQDPEPPAEPLPVLCNPDMVRATNLLSHYNETCTGVT